MSFTRLGRQGQRQKEPGIRLPQETPNSIQRPVVFPYDLRPGARSLETAGNGLAIHYGFDENVRRFQKPAWHLLAPLSPGRKTRVYTLRAKSTRRKRPRGGTVGMPSVSKASRHPARLGSFQQAPHGGIASAPGAAESSLSSWQTGKP